MNDVDETQLRITLMQTQIELYRRQERWEVAKALAAMAVGCGVLVGAVLGLAAYIARTPQQITVHLDAPLLVAPAR